MADEDQKPPEPKRPPGFLVNKCFEGDGVMIGDHIEVKVSRVKGKAAHLAVRAPLTLKIRRFKKT